MRHISTMYYVLALLVLVAIVIVAVSCHLNITSPMNYTDDVPNLEQVDPGVWRSGEPRSAAGWAYLKSLGIKTVVKLNYDTEGSDQAAIDAGLTVVYLPIPPENDLPSVFEKPNSDTIQKAVEQLAKGGGVLVHCTHGQDRTGIVVGIYRVVHDGWTKDAAWTEMVNHNFHQELVGLMEFWGDFHGSFPVVDD